MSTQSSLTHNLLTICIAALVLFTGCDSTTPSRVEDPTSPPQVPSENLEEMRDKMSDAALVLAEVSRDPEAISAVYESIEMRNGRGHGQNVSFAHLLKPELKVIDKSYASLGSSFADAFERASSAIEAKSSSSVSAKDLRQYLIENGITIYWPSHQNFADSDATPTVTYHPLTKEAEDSDDVVVTGYKPSPNKSLTTEEVLVDENYTTTDPTLVVAPCETYTTDDGNQMACIGEPGGGYNYQEPEASGTDQTPSSDEKFEVYLDQMQCRDDTDGWLSGGPDYRVYVYEPAITDVTVDEYKDTYNTFFPVDSFSGDECDDKRWESVGSSWDANWEKIDAENGFMVYDWDRFDGARFDYSAKYSGKLFGVTLSGSVKGDIDINNNEPLFKININRDAFVSTNDSDCRGLGMRNGACVRGGGSKVRFVLKSNSIQ